MRHVPAIAVVLLGLTATVSAEDAPAKKTVAVVVESSLSTSSSRIRQFAFDGKSETYFESETKPKPDDQFTFRFDEPVSINSAAVQTGKSDGSETLVDGVLEISFDGTAFEKAAAFENGKAELPGKERKIKALRIRTTKELSHPLVIREVTVDSEPALATFRYPIEFALDVSDAPEMKEWGEKAIRVCEKQYPLICDELASKEFKPLTRISLSLKKDYKGVAAAGGGRITGSVSYFKSHPDDIGAMVHETVHCVQSYRARRLPGWLVEGIADYYRFWKYEPGKAGKLNPERAKYDASYRTSAAFLAYVSETYDAKLVTKLNALLREGNYDGEAWKTLTGKTVEELGQEWKKSLAK